MQKLTIYSSFTKWIASLLIVPALLLVVGCSDRPSSTVSKTPLDIRLDENSSLWINGKEITYPYGIAQLEGVFGAPFRISKASVEARVHTWDNLGIVVGSYPNGNVYKFTAFVRGRRSSELETLPEKTFSGSISTSKGVLKIDGNGEMMVSLFPDMATGIGYQLDPKSRGYYVQRVGDLEINVFCKDSGTYRVTSIVIFPKR